MSCNHYDPIPSMHAPGFQTGHCLPQAGERPALHKDVYRYNRVIPMYPPDPCIRPNEGDMLCPPDCSQRSRNDLMPPAGACSPIGDRFAFQATRSMGACPHRQNVGLAACGCPVFANTPPCTALGPVTNQVQQCPCINRMNTDQSHEKPNRYHGHSTNTNHSSEGPQIHARGHSVQNPPNNPYEPMREGAIAPTPKSMTMKTSDGENANFKIARFGEANYHCQNPYYPSGYLCRPVYDRKYLDDCPEQDGPPPDSYTFL